MKEWGIDISRWQKGLDLSKFQYCKFVLIKAGGREAGDIYIDSMFLDFYTQAKLLGLPVGLYWYTTAVNNVNLQEEIDYLLDRVKGLQFELPIFLDLEEPVLYDQAGKLAVYWLNTLAEKGYYPGIYSSYSWWLDKLKNVSMDPIQKWVALWDSSEPDISCGFWQDGAITTQDIAVDSDYLFADYSFIRKKGLNGFKAVETFTDVTEDMASYKAIEWAASKGYVKGYPDGTFKPRDPVTREQLQIELWRMAGRPEP